ncbi:MAG: GNAT family N-acetyltransferase, partial [Janthinobacterium lividum]
MISGLLRRFGAQGAAIRTPRLRLIAITPGMLSAESAGKKPLSIATRAQVPPDWPPVYWELPVWTHIRAQLEAEPATFGWHRYMLSADRPHRLIGCLGGFPCTDGDVELGYSVINSLHRQGFGSEAAGALMDWLLHQPQVRSVS